MSDWDSLRRPGNRGRVGAATTPFGPPAMAQQPGFISGFIQSAASALPELFGAEPLPQAQAFRNANPWTGFASQLIAPGGAYGAVFRASRIPSMAARLEGATGAVAGRLGLEAATAPVRTGIIREAIRFAPLELTRLAGGGVIGAYDPLAAPWSEEGILNSDLFADVALSTAITGGIGGIGGFFRAGGRRGPQPARVEGADLQMTPTHQLKMLVDDGANVTGDLTAEQMRAQLRQEILTERTARGYVSQRPLPYLQTMEGVQTANDQAMINSLFDTRARKAGQQGLQKQLLAEGAETNLQTLNAGEQAGIVEALGFTQVDDVLKNSIFPRIVTARGTNGARALNGILTRPGLRPVGEDTLLGRERNGAFLIVKRISRGADNAVDEAADALTQTATAIDAPTAAATTERLGRTFARPGDRWFVAKTTNPGAFAPEAAALTEQNMAIWARWKQHWQPQLRSDVFNQNADLMLRALTPLDYHDMRRMNKSSWISQQTSKLGEKVGEGTGLRDSATLRQVAEWTYDTFKPTMFLEHQDSMFGRFFGLMRNSIRVADNYTHKIMQGSTRFRGRPTEAIRGKKVDFEPGFLGFRPVKQIADDLTPEEVNLIAHASAGSDLPAEALAELVSSGQLSAKAVQAVNELQALNRAMLDEVVLPVLKDLPHTADVNWLEGYIMPRIFKGDFRVVVKNEKGMPQFLAAGRTGAEAQREAKAVVDEARAQGKVWSMDETGLRHTVDPDASDLSQLQEQVVTRLATNSDDAAVVFQAMRKLASIRATTGRNPSVPTTTSTLRRRTAAPGSPDKQMYTHEDFLSSIEGHTRTLLRFAGMQSWKERFGGMAYSWGQNNSTLYNNLMRKSQQYMGIEGQITNTLNKALEPVLGPVLGKKAATKVAAATNEVMYNWNLALVNPTFALLNLLTPLQTVAPWVAYMTRAPKAEAAKMMQFIPSFDAAGKPVGTAGVLEPMKVLRESTKLMRDPTPELKQFLEEAMDDGVLSAQLYEEWVGRSARASQNLRDAYKEGGFVEFLRKGSTYMAEKSEQYSRMVAFNSGYLVGKNQFGLEGDALYRFARRATEVTMYQYGTVDRSRIFTGPIGSMFGLFKNWQMHFMGNMINYAGLGFRTGTWSPLLWNTASAFALGGLGATPLRTLADGMARWSGEAPSSYLWMQENWGESADEIYFGLPAMLGVSLQASSSIPGTDVRNELGHLGSFVIVERAKAIGKALGSAWQVQTATGENGLRDPNIRDQLLAALAPRAAYRAWSAIEGDYVRSMSTGYPMVRDVSPASQLLHGLGMNTTEIERWQVAAKELWNDQEGRRSTIQGLGQAYSEAMLAQDTERMQQIINRTIAMQLPVSSVMQSAQTRARREEESDLFSRFDAQMQSRYRQALEQ